jgi:hypothetical protein
MLSQKNQAVDTWTLLQVSQVRAMLELSQALKPQKTCDTLQYQQLAAMILYPYLHHIRAG